MSTPSLEKAPVRPTRPWIKTPVQRIPGLLISIIAVTISIGIVGISPLKGKLGFTLVFVPVFITLQYLLARVRATKKAAQDIVVASVVWAAGFLVFLPVMSILFTTIKRGLPGLNLKFLSQTMSIAAFTDPIGTGGILHAITGTLFLILISIVISVPLGILTALYLTEIKGPGSSFIQFIVQAMSGVPSVIAGLFVYSTIILTTPLRQSSFLGGLALAILMTPTVTRTAQEVLALIPNDLREAGLALGATQWKTVSMVVVPAAKSGLLTAVILGVARIAGETAPLIFTLGGADALNLNPLNGYNSALPLYVWKGFLIGLPEAIQRAWSAIFVLLLIVLTLFLVARSIGPKRARKKL